MYAVIATGGKQYRVAPGDRVNIEKIPGEIGDTVELDQVLLVAPDEGDLLVGKPTIEGAKVKAKIIGEKKGKKLIVQKFKRRKRYRVKTGHRQHHRQLLIDSIELPSE